MKRLTRFLACFLAAVLVVSNLQYVGVKAVEVEEIAVEAEGAESAVSENSLTLTFNDLGTPFGYGYGDVVDVDEKTGAATIKFNNEGGYGEVRYNLPAEIDTSKVSKVEILFEEGSAGVFLKVFLLKDAKGYEQDKWGNAADAMLNYTPAVEPEYQFKSIGLCSPDAQNDVVLKGIKITYGDEEKPVKEPPKAPETEPTVKAYTADDLTFSWADPDGEGIYEKKDGKWVVNFTQKQYAQVAFNLPEATELSQLASVKFTVADQTVPVSFKLLSGGKEVESETVYGQSGKTEYVITPKRDDSASIDGIGVMVTDEPKEGDTVSIVGVEFTVDPAMGGDEPPVTYGDNIIKNPNFADDDFSVWSMGASKSEIKAASQEEAIFDDVKTYGVIDRDASWVSEDGTQDARHEFFAQDVTKAIEDGGDLNRKPKYKVEFWAKLSEDYADAPANQRVVEFAPYIVTEQDGAVYLGASYSSQLSGNLSQTLTVGEWTKYEGTFEVTHDGSIKQVVIRIVEQGTEYGDISKGGACVKGDYYIAGVSMTEVIEPKTTIEEDIPNWKDSITAAFGDDAIAGTCLGSGTITMENLQALAKKHFNAITFENEMKPDITLGSTPTLDENGELVYNFNVADRMMAQIKKWNDADKTDNIDFKIRGHVLVWHSQTPEWFFHEDYDTSKDFVTPEVMNARMEHYIKAVFDHYKSVKFDDGTTAADMFYGWDVVNEAMSDTTGKPRKGSDSSSWAKVYGDESNEYIINAFRYANKYAPANIRLYYNDYNDCNEPKATGIAELLETITAAEKDAVNPTRIDGMGMQAHHNYSDPTAVQIKSAINKYLTALGEGGVVEMTEFDVKASNTYDGTAASLKSEHAKQAWRFKEIFDAYKEIETAKPGSVGGITMWGVVDERSWLQSSNSVGGASSGGTHAPLLFFTENYVSKAKPAFWAFVDQDKLEPYINEVNAMNTDKIEYASENEAKAGDITFKYKTYWSEGKLNFWVDDSLSGKEVVLYTDLAADGTPDTPVPFENGTASIDIADIDVNQTYLFDIVVGGKAYNDTKGTFAETSTYYAKVTTKPLMQITKGTAYVDGNIADWADVEPVTLGAYLNEPGASAKAKVCWDEENLYVLMDVMDSALDATNTADHEKDSMELFIDELNEKSGAYDANDKQYRVNYLNEQTFNNAGGYCAAEYIDSAVKVIEGKGYVIEAAIKWTALEAKPGELIGLDLQINNAENGKRVGTANWYDTSGNGYQNSGLFGTGILVDADETTADDTAKVEAAEKAIEEIGTVAYTAASKAKLDAAEEVYAGITVAQRLSVENKATFVAAMNTYKKLDDEVKAAEKAIEAIGDVTYSEESLKAITAAKEAYEALNDDQKAAMDKDVVAKIAVAEKAYEDAKAEYIANEENKKNDAAAVKNVTDKINAIGKVAYDTASKAKIDEARKAYDALTQAQKDQVDAAILKILTDAEAAYKVAEEAAKETEKKEETKVEYFAKFSVTSVPLKKGQSSTALAKDIQIAEGDKVVKWTTSNKKIVTVNSKTGKIKGKKVGKATITATTKSGKTAKITVKVQKKAVAAKKVTLTNKATNKAIKAKSTVTLKKGKNMTVVANVAPMTCAQKVKFTSSNKKVATVSSKGVIKGKKKGTATITAKVGKKTFKFKVKVK